MSFDYCEFGNREMPDAEDGAEDDDGPTPVLVMHNSVGKIVFAHAVPTKALNTLDPNLQFKQ